MPSPVALSLAVASRYSCRRFPSLSPPPSPLPHRRRRRFPPRYRRRAVASYRSPALCRSPGSAATSAAAASWSSRPPFSTTTRPTWYFFRSPPLSRARCSSSASCTSSSVWRCAARTAGEGGERQAAAAASRGARTSSGDLRSGSLEVVDGRKSDVRPSGRAVRHPYCRRCETIFHTVHELRESLTRSGERRESRSTSLSHRTNRTALATYQTPVRLRCRTARHPSSVAPFSTGTHDSSSGPRRTSTARRIDYAEAAAVGGRCQ